MAWQKPECCAPQGTSGNLFLLACGVIQHIRTEGFARLTAQRCLAVLTALEYETALARRCIRLQGQQDTPVGTLWHGSVCGRSVILLRCGMGAERAQQAAAWIANTYLLQGMISIGFAGGLQPDLDTGDAVLAQHIQAYTAPSGNFPAIFSDPITPTPHLLHIAAKAAALPTSTVYHGALLSADSVVAAATQKQRLGQLSNALAVDMEAHSIAQVAIRHQLSFVSLKTVFDTYHDDLSLHLTQCTRPTGTVRLASLASTVLRHPSLMTRLPQLKRKAKTAGQRLENWLYQFLMLVRDER